MSLQYAALQNAYELHETIGSGIFNIRFSNKMLESTFLHNLTEK
jgi:hypothetical protein